MYYIFPQHDLSPLIIYDYI